ncbi:phosphotransferase [Frankia sp. Cppng1_Ct_nod]|uniref:phosphotransferase n=1 Tax=Frankia sp. Cppng1_Ct_nod TaxID=2897162 RepID=UPI00104187B1|nr:phosphotransferase [Frankia sp. Cppng1_Ct_nod]
MVRFPVSIKDLTPELLTSLLGKIHPDVVVEQVDLVGATRIGLATETGEKASTADRLTLGLRYVAGRDGGLPARMFLKTLLVEDDQQSLPRAAPAMYRTEIGFYQEVRPQLDVEAPRMFAGDLDEETGRFVVLIEDLSLQEATFPNALGSLSPEQAAALLSQLARVHARYWSSPDLHEIFPWLETPDSGETMEFFRITGRRIFDKQLRLDWKSEIVAALDRPRDEIWDALWKLQKLMEKQPQCLLHGDAHVANTYLLPTGGGLLDWQFCKAGSWAHDVAYLIVTALAPEHRRAFERDLIAGYLDELRRHGVTPPGADEAWLLYRQNIVWGVVVGWVMTPPTHHGQALISANLERCVTAATDLGSFAAVG